MRLAAIIFSSCTLGFSHNICADSISDKFERQANQIEQLQQQMLALKNDNAAKGFSGVDQAFRFSSYGSVVYANREVFKNVQDNEPTRRAEVDLERLVAEVGYQFDDNWSVEFEVEFEHGGTGLTLEYDGFEEFGEFETEVEAGGEVIVEKLQLQYQSSDALGFKLGHIYVPVGMTTSLHKPHQYFTVSRHRSLENMLPAVWHETGAAIFGQIDNFNYQAQIVTGLNSEYFRTYNWAAGASQTRFERVNADDLAFVVRLDYGDIKQGSAIGFSYYIGNTSGNRHKTNQLDVDGRIRIVDLHGVYQQGGLTLRGQYLLGQLDDSNAITAANRNTPGLRVGNFAQLGSEAQALFIEAGYDISALVKVQRPLSVFGSFDYSNPLSEVDSDFGSERFEISDFSLGINYSPTKQLIFKAQIGQQQTAMSSIPDTTSFELGLGYYFSL